MDDDTSEQGFGCGRCWPPSADAAWEARRELARAAELIDESHVHVMILACPCCSQRFLSIFTEMIDWVDGEDPQYWTLLPLTGAEADELVRQQDSLTEATLGSLGRDRRCLHRDHPKAAAPRSFWATGVSVGQHD